MKNVQMRLEDHEYEALDELRVIGGHRSLQGYFRHLVGELSRRKRAQLADLPPTTAREKAFLLEMLDFHRQADARLVRIVRNLTATISEVSPEQD